MRYKELLNTNDILHLLTNKLNFAPKQMGKSIFFLCPFHSDKNPSLSFEPSRKIFTCFSCSFKASDIFDFWAQYKKITSEEALVEISQLGYFSLAVIQEKKKQEQKNKNKIFVLNSLVTDIYQHNLFTEPGREVLNYLQNQRRISRTMIERFSLGCTISNKQITNIFSQAKNDNFSSFDLTTTNLTWITNDNRMGDFFGEKQLIIPLTNHEGKIVSFAARKIGTVPVTEGKYKYLPSHQYYHKSSLLYNYPVVKKSRTEECYLVEGFFDVISLTERGVENCVALLGTNLAEEQLKLLSELKKRIIIFLDGDRAGQEATINVSTKLLLNEIDCEIVKSDYPDDPDQICHYPEQNLLFTILQQRENPYSFILDHYFQEWKVAENPQRINRFVSEIAKIFQKFKTNIQDFLIEKISLLVKWNKNEIEPYFIQRQFPVHSINYYQIIYCQELIQNKEKRILCLCAQNRNFWLITMSKNYFFWKKTERENWQNIYNKYTAAPDNKISLKEIKDYYCQVSHQENKFLPQQQKEFMDKIFQEINNIKIFLLNYEKN